MNWLRRLFGIKTNFEIMLEHVQKSHERDVELIRMQMGTIDRVITARYDRPTLAQETPMQVPEVNVDDMVDVNVEDDEWLSRMQ